MAFKSPTQPFCRVCGKPIRKITETVYVYPVPQRTEIAEMRNGDRSKGEDLFKQYPTGKMTPIHVPMHVVGNPKNKAEAQTLVNQKIISVSRGRDREIDSVGTWDGESYADAFFCSGPCTSQMAYGAMNLYPGLHFRPYAEVIAGKLVKT